MFKKNKYEKNVTINNLKAFKNDIKYILFFWN